MASPTLLKPSRIRVMSAISIAAYTPASAIELPTLAAIRVGSIKAAI